MREEREREKRGRRKEGGRVRERDGGRERNLFIILQISEKNEHTMKDKALVRFADCIKP